MPDVDDAGALYGLAPEEFTAARDSLVRRLRKAGERERAAEVRRLRRPSALAWALNRAARERPQLVDAALAAGHDLREAMAGGDIRQAERASRQASDAIVEEAVAALSGVGQTVSDEARSRLAGTVRAAVLAPDVADRLRAGTLERDVEVPGLGVDDSVEPPPPRRASHDAEQRKAEEEERRRQEKARRAAGARVAHLESEADRLAGRASRLATAADRAELAAAQARGEADEAQAEATKAESLASAARDELAAATASREVDP